MSDHASPSRLAFAIVLGPIAALVNQGSIYATVTWACERNTRAPLHAIAALCLAVAGGTALRVMRGVRRTAESGDDVDGELRRTRFMTRTALGTGVFSSLVILAQWVGVVLFGPCTRT